VSEASLAGVREKFGQAENHFKLLQAEIRAWLHRDPQPIGLSIPYLDTESGWHVLYGIVNEQPPLRLGVILGDFLHNARSALDHLVWQLVIANGHTPRAGPRGNAWPFAHTEDEWSTALGSHLRGVAPEHQALIKRTQPYEARNRPEAPSPEDTIPARLRFLSDIDKHQIVNPALMVIGDPGEGLSFRVVHGPGEIVKRQVNAGAAFEHGAPLVRVRVEPLTPDTEVEMNGDAPADVAFSERRFPIGVAKQILEAVRVIVREFEPVFDS
jgi:hypothetical protein